MSGKDRRRTGRTVAVVGAVAVLAGVLATAFLVGGTAAVGSDGAPDSDATAFESSAVQSTTGVSETASEVPVPEPGDEYYEAAAPDGSWISYINTRDEYRDPYLGDGSGKLCVTLVNEAGEPVVGESVPNTTATMSTGDELEWHSQADPITVEYPLTDNYEQPLDSDQFGTNSELPQGDGYLDSHCIEMHGQPEDGTIEYGEVEVDGEHADDVEVVGYVQQAHDAWDTDVDPVEDAVPYEDAGGWTYEPDGTHGQAVAVLQLTANADEFEDGESGSEPTDGNGDDPSETDQSNETDGNGSDDDGTNASDGADSNGADGGESSDTDDSDGLPGFGAAVAVTALAAVAVGVARR
ncbi:PGF-CTERM sorting domain-containing protein [Natronococcus jeotgali]|nr:PGF-CTERM sorting domain-containing protein [Natronococcus jeotgali]